MIGLWWLIGCATEPAALEESDSTVVIDETEETDAPDSPGRTRVEMRDVELEQPGGLTRVRYLVGTVTSTKKGSPPAIDSPTGYAIRVEKAEVAVDWRTLSAMLSKSKDGKPAPLAEARFSNSEDGLLMIEAEKPVPFRLRSEVGVDPEGRLTIRLVTLEALGVGTGLVRAVFGVKLDDLVKDGEGLVVKGDTVHLDPLAGSPPPKVRAKVIGAEVEDDGLVLRLGGVGVHVAKETSSASVASAADGPKSNFLWFHDGTIISGNVTIRDTDLRLMDQDPSDALRLASDTSAQIQAGYLKQLAGGKVEIHLPDANDLATAKATP